jgi:hypothetical protein
MLARLNRDCASTRPAVTVGHTSHADQAAAPQRDRSRSASGTRSGRSAALPPVRGSFGAAFGAAIRRLAQSRELGGLGKPNQIELQSCRSFFCRFGSYRLNPPLPWRHRDSPCTSNAPVQPVRTRQRSGWCGKTRQSCARPFSRTSFVRTGRLTWLSGAIWRGEVLQRIDLHGGWGCVDFGHGAA